MMRRRYTLRKRADAAATTRRRIVEATMRVHDEQGITRTSVRDVAERAGVAPATVLHHFPRMGDLIRACGELSDALAPMPTPAVLVGADDPREAVRLAARAMFEWWDRMGPGWEHLQIDRRTLAEVDAWLRDVDERHRALIAEALGDGAAPSIVAVLTALTSYGSWQSLRAGGMAPDRAAAEVARIIPIQRGVH
jgi:AcrR family transcriptional regulator